MVFWIAAAALTLAACLAVLAPLARRAGDEDVALDHDLTVYRDQLSELDRDAARGLIGEAEAEESRAEIGRRMLKIDAARRQTVPTGRGRFARIASMTAVLAVPLISWGVYAALGSPNMPDEPLQARLQADPAKNSIDELVARAEEHLNANPTDGRGWDVLAPIYLRMGRFADADVAFRNSIRLAGSTAARESGHGEALAALAGGLVSAEAQSAFERAVKLDPTEPRARFYLATARAQEGKNDEAVKEWTAMLTSLPSDSPWRAAVEQAVMQAKGETATASAGPSAGPSAEDVDAAASMSTDDRTAMIEGMVARLDERLRGNPADPEGWMRLMRSYMMLGRKDAAEDALARSGEALADQPEARREVSKFAASLGLTGTDVQ